MANEYRNRLIIVEMKGEPQQFASLLELAMYGQKLTPGHPCSVVGGGGDNPELYFETKWQPPEKELQAVSKKLKSLLVLKYNSFDSGLRGHMIISDGRVLVKRSYEIPPPRMRLLSKETERRKKG